MSQMGLWWAGVEIEGVGEEERVGEVPGKDGQCPGDGMGVAITERNEVERGGVLGYSRPPSFPTSFPRPSSFPTSFPSFCLLHKLGHIRCG